LIAVQAVASLCAVPPKPADSRRSAAPSADRAFGSAHRRVGRRATAGFTLLEISVVIFIISVIAAFAVPALKTVVLESRARALANDLRVFAGAFQAYAQEKGDWPSGESAPGTVPAGMTALLGKTNWERVTPIGGHYTWAPNSLQQGERYRAAILISSTDSSRVSSDKRQLQEVDRTIDDGDLDAGNLRLGYRNFPVFVIEH
jgi:prepilin-type N-terminal cleavage/methylation domain-containing protein